jgi:hypothetical protein
MGSLPRGIPVEIEVIVEVEDAACRAHGAAAAKPRRSSRAKADAQKVEEGGEQKKR